MLNKKRLRVFSNLFYSSELCLIVHVVGDNVAVLSLFQTSRHEAYRLRRE